MHFYRLRLLLLILHACVRGGKLGSKPTTFWRQRSQSHLERSLFLNSYGDAIRALALDPFDQSSQELLYQSSLRMNDTQSATVALRKLNCIDHGQRMAQLCEISDLLDAASAKILLEDDAVVVYEDDPALMAALKAGARDNMKSSPLIATIRSHTRVERLNSTILTESDGYFCLKRDANYEGYGIFAMKPIAGGSRILEELPFVSFYLDNKGAMARRCSHCFRSIRRNPSLACDCDMCGEKYCSAPCRAEARKQYHGLLCELRSASSDAELPGRSLTIGKRRNTSKDFRSIEAAARRQQQDEYSDLRAGGLCELACLAMRAIARCLSETSPGGFQVARSGIDEDSVEAAATLQLSDSLLCLSRLTDVDSVSLLGVTATTKSFPVAMVQDWYAHLYSVFSAALPMMDIQSAVAMHSLIVANAISVSEGGTALLTVGSFFNHDCHPNVDWEKRQDDDEKDDGNRQAQDFPNIPNRAVRFFALRDIEEGEQLTISYLGEDVSFEESEAAFESQYGVKCSCKRCKASRAFRTS